jgi:hypothetical protein
MATGRRVRLASLTLLWARGESRSLSTSSASAVTPPELSTYLWDLLYPQSVLLSAGIQVVTTGHDHNPDSR